MNTTKLIMAMAAAAMVAACSDSGQQTAATGIFEATEITVAAEQNGRIVMMRADEGDRLDSGQQVAMIDTVQLYLKARQIGAAKEVYAFQRPDMAKQMAALRQQTANARQERDRFKALVSEGAANRKTLDDAENAVLTLERQLAALESSLSNSKMSLDRQMSAADIQRMQVADQLAKCRVAAPAAGTVIEKYAEQGEFAAIGRPLFKMADLTRMYLRAYITTAQLQHFKIGQQVKVAANYGAGRRREYTGRVTWISARPEFTPKTILTDDERADIVYAMKVRVDNADGSIKIGMYGEVAEP